MNHQIVYEIVSKLKELNVDIEVSKLHSVIEDVVLNYDIEPLKTHESLIPLSTVISYYLECKKSERKTLGTLKNMKYTMSKVAKILNDKPIQRVTITDIRLVYNEVCKGKKETTITNKGEQIRSFFNWCHMEGYTQENQVRKLHIPRCNKNVRKSLNQTQLENARDNFLDTRDRAIFEFLLSTGCRVSEISDIKVSDAMSGQVLVKGKGSYQRMVYVNDKAMYWIKKYLSTRKGDSEYLFISTKKPFNKIGTKAIECAMRKLSKSNTPISFTPHIVRHTFASMALQNGADLMDIKEWLGHKAVSTTQIYLTIPQKKLQQTHEKVVIF